MILWVGRCSLCRVGSGCLSSRSKALPEIIRGLELPGRRQDRRLRRVVAGPATATPAPQATVTPRNVRADQRPSW